MWPKQKPVHIALVGVFAIVGVFGMVSIALAQSGTWTKKADMPT